MQNLKHRELWFNDCFLSNSKFSLDWSYLHLRNLIEYKSYRYVTHEDIQRARLIRRRRQTAQSNPETLRSSHNKSNDSCNVSEIGSYTSQDRGENKRPSLKLAAAAFSGIDTSLLYDPVLDQSYISGGESVCR